MNPTHSIIALSEEHAQFISGGVAIDLAARDRRNIPRVARGLACRVSPDRRRITVIVANRLIDQFLESIKSTQAIAAVFCLASTHRAIQIKGYDAAMEPVLPSDADLVERTIIAFAADITAFGFEEAHVRADMTYRVGELVSIVFSPSVVYEQTPGPKAGTQVH